MTADQERVFESYCRVQGWMVINPQFVTNNPSLGTQLETLNGIVNRMSDHAAAQEVHYAQTLLVSTDEIEKREEVLSYHMVPIAKVARALRGTVPGIGVLTAPKGNVKPQELITAATAMAEKAVIYKDVLVESGLPADFIEQLTAATAALKASINGRGLARAARVAATEGVGNEEALGRRTVQIIDALVTRQLRNDPSKLAEWKQLKRVTVKGVAVRAPLGVVDTGAKPAETSSTATVAASGASVQAA